MAKIASTVLSAYNSVASSSTAFPSLVPSLLPFSITHDGPAEISRYFSPRDLPSSSSSNCKRAHQDASFRGRLVVSTEFELPPNYTGLVISSSAPTSNITQLNRNQHDDEEDAERRAKKARFNKPLKKVETAAAARGKNGSLLRRSPRKKVAVKKFSLDSDEEDEHANEDVTEIAAEAIVVSAVVQVEESPMEEEISIPPVVEETIETVSTALPTLSASSSLTLSDTPRPITPLTDYDASPLSISTEEKILKPVAKFSSIRIWHADFALDEQEDVYAKNLLEWTQLAAKVISVHSG